MAWLNDLWTRFTGRSPTIKSGTQWVDPATLKLGPIRHEELSPDQMARVERLHEVFAPLAGTFRRTKSRPSFRI
jgi:hypothetical protein